MSGVVLTRNVLRRTCVFGSSLARMPELGSLTNQRLPPPTIAPKPWTRPTILFLRGSITRVVLSPSQPEAHTRLPLAPNQQVSAPRLIRATIRLAFGLIRYRTTSRWVLTQIEPYADTTAVGEPRRLELHDRLASR